MRLAEMIALRDNMSKIVAEIARGSNFDPPRGATAQ
jgi:hypothetical protein